MPTLAALLNGTLHWVSPHGKAVLDLPPLQKLAAWVRLLGWVFEWEHRRTSLCRQAIRGGGEPPVCYRTVRRITGARWEEVRELGTAWVLMQLTAQSQRQPTTRDATELPGGVPSLGAELA